MVGVEALTFSGGAGESTWQSAGRAGTAQRWALQKKVCACDLVQCVCVRVRVLVYAPACVCVCAIVRRGMSGMWTR